ncbi:MAG: hypothetical protein GC154_11340 [bacterium]|nr:hypothetical protein [bacterium]
MRLLMIVAMFSLMMAPASLLLAAVPLKVDELRKLALQARLDDAGRNGIALRMAALIEEADTASVKHEQRAVQESLLLLCDRDVYDTLQPSAIRAIDVALESHFSLDEISRDVRIDPVAYVYGYFNRDVTVDQIVQAGDLWRSLSLEERAPRYPAYIHLIDAVCKPLSMGMLDDGEDATRQALEYVTPLLKEMISQPPRPGTAFHEPTHPALILGPLYERWIDHPRLGGVMKRLIGGRDDLIEFLTGRLVSRQPDPLKFDKTEQQFFAYTGRYFANVLARLNARSAVDALRGSIEVYRKTGADAVTIHYTEGALIALGDESLRKRFEETTERNDKIETLVWLIRNGKGETVEYASRLLGAELQCPPRQALRRYFQNRLDEME